MITRPTSNEAAPPYFKYINQVIGDDPLGTLQHQMETAQPLLAGISEEKSLFRYAPGKWSIRQLLNHVTDTERAFAFRALWFARGFDSALPGFDQDVAAAGAEADQLSWKTHVEEVRLVRLSTIALFSDLPARGLDRGGVASDNFVTVRALAYIIPGHFAHHMSVLRDRYL